MFPVFYLVSGRLVDGSVKDLSVVQVSEVGGLVEYLPVDRCSVSRSNICRWVGGRWSVGSVENLSVGQWFCNTLTSQSTSRKTCFVELNSPNIYNDTQVLYILLIPICITFHQVTNFFELFRSYKRYNFGLISNGINIYNELFDQLQGKPLMT